MVNLVKVTGLVVVVNVMKVTCFVPVNLVSDGYGYCEQCDESDGLCGGGQ